MSSKPILTNLDLRKNEIQNSKLINVSIEILSSEPSTPELGQIYFDSELSVFRIWSGTDWKALPIEENVLTSNGGTINGDLVVTGYLTINSIISALENINLGDLRISKASNGYVNLDSNVLGTQLKLKGVSTNSQKLDGQNSSYYLNAGNLIGTVPLKCIPAGALERVIQVPNDKARFALTSNKVQLGDVVKVESTKLMYYVKDQTKLNSEKGYTVFTAGMAAKADVADRVKNQLSIQFNDGETINYNGSDSVHVNITPSNIGAAIEANGFLGVQGYVAAFNARLSDDTSCFIDPISGALVIPAISGIQGPDGNIGPQGYIGDRGVQGYLGDIGPQGIQGPDGNIGAQGFQGELGWQGWQGYRGFKGPEGTQGEIGPQGFQGDRGFQGNIGDVGPQGDEGPQGEIGRDGVGINVLGSLENIVNLPNEGIYGDAYLINGILYVWAEFSGDTNEGLWRFCGDIVGPKGDTGSQGNRGFQGFTGSNGSNGDRGFQGFTGATGSTGSTGSVGATGSQGNRGFQGFTGTTGAGGFQGSPGATGSTGSQGNRGFQGFAGTTGAGGFQGSTGATGSTGSQGNRGFQGFAGATGPQGSSSDIRLKENIVNLEIDNIASKLSSLRKVKFNFISDDKKIVHIGTIAQDVKEVFPELVCEDEKGYLSVYYDKLSVMSLYAIDDLYNRLEKIENSFMN
jgi:hypothetical protein